MSKQVIFDPQEGLLRGVNTLERAVASTLGPKGRTVIIETPYGATTVTKDGVTVAEHITLPDAVENLGALLIKQAAQKTASVAGDGTTTATIIAAALANAAHVESKTRAAIDIKREIDSEVEKLVEHLNKISTAVTLDDVLAIATISANNDQQLGTLIHDAYKHVSLDGLIAIEDSKTGKTYITLNEGFVFSSGYLSPYFVTDARKKVVELENPVIYVSDKKIKAIREILPALEYAKSAQRPLLIISDEVDLNALGALTYNHVNGIISACAVRAPSFGENRGEILKDIAALTSATVFSEKAGLTENDLNPSFYGTARKVVITQDSTTIIDGKRSPEVETRIAQIEEQLKHESTDDYIVTQLSTRLAGLKAKVAIINVGAATDSELKERKARVDDALRATRSAIAKGYVLGAGKTLFDLAEMTDSMVLKTALLAPVTKLAESVNMNYDSLAQWMLEGKDFGLDASAEKFVNLRDAKIFDPTLVLEQALINAASAASMILLSSTVVYSTDRTPPYSPGSLDDLSA